MISEPNLFFSMWSGLLVLGWLEFYCSYTRMVDVLTLTRWSNPALTRTFSAVGCHSTYPTRRLCPCRSTSHSVRWVASPPSGMYHSFTVQSSLQDAIMLSLNGFHLMSKTGPLWPVTRDVLKSSRPVCYMITMHFRNSTFLYPNLLYN